MLRFSRRAVGHRTTLPLKSVAVICVLADYSPAVAQRCRPPSICFRLEKNLLALFYYSTTARDRSNIIIIIIIMHYYRGIILLAAVWEGVRTVERFLLCEHREQSDTAFWPDCQTTTVLANGIRARETMTNDFAH